MPLSFKEMLPFVKQLTFRSASILLAGLVILAGCSSDEVAAPRSAEEVFQSGLKMFANEDYLEAKEEFRIVTLQYQGSALADDAQFYLSECYFKREEFILASYEYEILLRTMPTSEFVPNSRFQRALCYYNRSPESYLDQESTRKAIDEFQAFLEYHPTDPRAPEAETKINEMNTKLARKDYENGIIYMKMEYYKAATVSFDYVLEKYHDTPYAEPSLLKKGEALFYRKRYTEAKEIADRFLEKYPNSPVRGDAEKLRTDAADKILEMNRKPAVTPSATTQRPVDQ